MAAPRTRASEGKLNLGLLIPSLFVQQEDGDAWGKEGKMTVVTSRTNDRDKQGTLAEKRIHNEPVLGTPPISLV